MNRKRLRPAMMLFAFMLVLGSMVGVQPGITHAESLDHGVTISASDYEGEDVLPLTAVEFEPGENVYDVLKKATEERDLNLETEEYAGMGHMVKRIGDVEEDIPLYWSFNTQGLYTDKGVSATEMENGDNLTFTFISMEDGMNAPEMTVSVSAVDNDGEKVLEKTEVDLTVRSSAYDAIYQAANEQNVDLDVSVDNETFTSIDGIGDIELDEDEYWEMTVNEESYQKSPVQKSLNDGDAVQFQVQQPSDENKEEDEKNDMEKPDKVGNKDSDDNSETESDTTPIDAKENIDGLLTYVDKNITLEYFSEWWIWGLAHTNYTIPDSYLDSVNEEINVADGEFRSLELQKIIIALSLLGEDVTDIQGYNLIDILADEDFKTGINGYIYSLLAADSGQYEMDQEFREKVITHILENEKDGGGWALFGDEPTVDITAMALAALVPYQDQADVKAATDRAIDYLSDVQEDNGGYFEEFNGGDSSESVSQVIIALSALGIDSTSDAFTAEDGNLLEHLTEFKRDDGGYKHIIDDDYTNPMANQQALLAYVAYEKFLQGKGSVYQPTVNDNDNGDDPEDGDNKDKDKPDNDKEKPENDNETPEDNDKGKPENNDVSVQPEKESQVNAGQTVMIKDTDTTVKLPSDLPEGTTLTVTDASNYDEVTEADGMELAGDVYEFNFAYMKGSHPSKAFTLTMAYDKDKYDADEVAVYYYDEANDTWVQVDGDVNVAEGTITIETDHFSIYGVFAKTDDDDEKDDTNNGDDGDDNTTNDDPSSDNTDGDGDEDTVVPGTDNDENTEDNTEDELPETATNMFNYMLIGLSLLIVSAILFFIKRKQRVRA